MDKMYEHLYDNKEVSVEDQLEFSLDCNEEESREKIADYCVADILATESLYDRSQVEHPSHYNAGNIECIDALDSMMDSYSDVHPKLASYAWQVVKYVWRAPIKGNMLRDLRKADFYLDRLIRKIEDREKRHLYGETEADELSKICSHSEPDLDFDSCDDCIFSCKRSDEFPCIKCRHNIVGNLITEPSWYTGKRDEEGKE